MFNIAYSSESNELTVLVYLITPKNMISISSMVFTIRDKTQMRESAKQKKNFLFLNSNICCGYGSYEYPKYMLKIWVRKYIQFYAQNICLSKPVI